MKITFISPAFYMSGGVKIIRTYAQELARLGHSVTIVSQPLTPIRFLDQLRSLKNGNGWVFRPTIDAPKGVRHILIDAARPINESDVPDSDVVIATWWETAEWVSSFPRSKGRKFYFVQGHETFDPIPKRSQDTYRMPLKKIVVSRWLQEIMQTEYGDNNVSVVPNSIDRFEFFAPERGKQPKPTLGLLYSTAWPKGLDTSLQVIRRVQTKIENLQIKSFGSESQSRSLTLPSQSYFKRSPSSQQIRDIYTSCDVWLTSSRSDGFNLTAFEAMACRTPVVSTRIGWPAEGIVTGVNGGLCDVDNVEQLTDSCSEILSSSDSRWRFMSGAAYITTTTSSWAESTKLLERELMSV